MRSLLSFRMLLALSIAAGTTAGGVVGAHTDYCFQEQHSITYWYGHEHVDECNAGNGQDSMYGYGYGDDLRGGGGDDLLRGATGSDHLRDGASGSDTDTFCDGDDYDYIHMDDGDGADHLHRIEDIYQDAVYWSSGDTWHEGTSAHSDCPM